MSKYSLHGITVQAVYVYQVAFSFQFRNNIFKNKVY